MASRLERKIMQNWNKNDEPSAWQEQEEASKIKMQKCIYRAKAPQKLKQN
jgi:hypothetical protein